MVREIRYTSELLTNVYVSSCENTNLKKNKNIKIKQTSTKDVRGQFLPVSHGLLSWSLPVQFVPLYIGAGWSHDRFLSCTPFSHVTEQLLHGLHDPQCPSTVNQNNNNYK